jgi:hypothetical protein
MSGVKAISIVFILLFSSCYVLSQSLQIHAYDSYTVVKSGSNSFSLEQGDITIGSTSGGLFSADKLYRGQVRFATDVIPEHAIITGATLRLVEKAENLAYNYILNLSSPEINHGGSAETIWESIGFNEIHTENFNFHVAEEIFDLDLNNGGIESLDASDGYFWIGIYEFNSSYHDSKGQFLEVGKGTFHGVDASLQDRPLLSVLSIIFVYYLAKV